MVENENLLLWYKNEEKYINDSTIASLLQDMLNKAAGAPLFKVYLETKAKLDADEAYTCTLKTRIEPYMLKGAHCESVNVRLSIKYPLENEQEKIKVINIVTKCLGYVTGGFKVHDNKALNGHVIGDSDEQIDYTFCSNFTKDESTTPENINSHYTGTLTLKGNMHITRSDGGILSDTVETYILIKDKQTRSISRAALGYNVAYFSDDKFVAPDEGVVYPSNGGNGRDEDEDRLVNPDEGGVYPAVPERYKEYYVVGRTVEGSWQAVTDNPIKAGSFIPDTEYNAVTNAKSLILLFRNDYICNLLRDFAQGLLGENNDFIDEATGKPVLTLKEKYPDGKIVQDTYYIYEVKETREAGSYMCLSIALLKRP